MAYVFIKMANSPRPGVWVLEKSVDNGITYQPWQYFADTPGYVFCCNITLRFITFLCYMQMPGFVCVCVFFMCEREMGRKWKS